MGLRDMVAFKEPTADDVKEKITAAVKEAVAANNPFVEIDVPYALCEEMRAWVESEGIRCGCAIGNKEVEGQKHRDRCATLVLSLKLAPFTAEELAAVAKRNAEFFAEMERQRAFASVNAEARVAALEADLADVLARLAAAGVK